MTTFALRSKTFGVEVFFVGASARSLDGKGYVYLGSSTLGRQLCYGGGFTGSTLRAAPDDLPAVVRRWHRQRMRLRRRGYTF